MLKPWRVTNRSFIVDDRWLRLRADTCELEDGRRVDPYYVIEAPTWVNIVAVTAAANVVMVSQYRHGTGSVEVELPCGVAEAGDLDHKDSIRRELLEETGYAVTELVLTGACHVNPARFDNQVFSYIGLGASPVKASTPDHTEQLEIEERPLVDVIESLRSESCRMQAMHMLALYRSIDWLRKHRPELISGC